MMKKFILLTLLSLPSLGISKPEEPSPPSSSQDHSSSIIHDMPVKAAAAHKRRGSQKHNEIMIISPEARAQDLLNAFQYLKRANGAKKFGVRLTNGDVLSNIFDIEVMPGGTIIIFKIHSMKGESVRVVTVESVDTIIQAHA